MGFKIKYDMVDTKNIYGLYLARRAARDSLSKITTYDLYAEHDFGLLGLQLELVFQNGSVSGHSLDSTGLLARLYSDISPTFRAAFELGSASGDDIDNDDKTGFSFNPDFLR